MYQTMYIASLGNSVRLHILISINVVGSLVMAERLPEAGKFQPTLSFGRLLEVPEAAQVTAWGCFGHG